MFAAATSFFARTAISQSYNIGVSAGASPGNGSRSSTPGPGGSIAPTPASTIPPATAQVPVGLWKVQAASHKTTGKRVSVWTFDKRGPDVERLGPMAKERTLEVLKAEASALGRLRHPCILEMVEPMEETRNELVFATEPVLSSLELAIPGAGRFASIVELDEVEIQKGILQICKGLSFLHTSAKLFHSNISPESIIINSAGDWKISGLGLTIPLLQPGGAPTRWEFPTFDGRVPSYIQRSFDYMAPEYALDEKLLTSSDMYSLGALIYSVHSKGSPPFHTHGSLSGLRDSISRGIGSVQGMKTLDPDLQQLLTMLLTRQPDPRPTPTSLPSHSFFSSLPISTLNFLDRANFTTKSREEKIGFMKGLSSVLDKFSESLRTRKILPSLLEEMKDVHLLPYILPNVFVISTSLSSHQFAQQVLPSLKPLFAVKEPPQNMLTLLDNLEMLRSKTEKNVFRHDVLPLVYNALESEHAMVQERALAAIPPLCENIDYAEVQGVIFPRVAIVFSQTRILSVKIATLTTFLSMVKTLDQSSLTQKLVPLLSKIRTKEPAVMMTTLSVQEAMGFKVDREAVATLVLPQLWSMSIGPLLNVEQFGRFMEVIRKLSDRVEKEHNQFLRDSQRLEDRSSAGTGTVTPQNFAGTVDFQTLVGNGAATSKPAENKTTSWDEDVWGSIFNDNVPQTVTMISPTVTSQPTSPRQESFSAKPSRLGARMSSTSSAASYNAFPSPPKPFSPPIPTQPLQPTFTGGSTTSNTSSSSSKPNYNISLSSMSSPPLQPSWASSPLSQTMPPQNKPNYGVSMAPSTGFGQLSPSLQPSAPSGMGMMAPMKPSTLSPSTKPASSNNWDDFDPLA